MVAAQHIAAENRFGPIQTSVPVGAPTKTAAANTLRTTTTLASQSEASSKFLADKASNGTTTQLSSKHPLGLSSNSAYQPKHHFPSVNVSYTHRYLRPHDSTIRCASTSTNIISNVTPKSSKPMNVFHCLKFIYVTEGVFGLWKGLGPNLMGVAPSRAIYFWAYSTAKKNINGALPRKNRDTPFVHVVSAMCAGFSASSTTNPIWLVKTRLQLDRVAGKKRMTIRKSIRNIYREGVSLSCIHQYERILMMIVAHKP